MQQLNLYKLTPRELKTFAVMQNLQTSQELYLHHKGAYKINNRKYRKVMQDKLKCLQDDTGPELITKFAELLNS